MVSSQATLQRRRVDSNDTGKYRRGKSYQDLENLELAKAYVHVFTDASVGISQSAETFWMRIKDKMESSARIANAMAKGELEPRAWTSLQARFSVMQRSIGKCTSCVTLVESLRESGTTERDMMKKALSMYQERHSKAFTFLEPYDVLSKVPKFQASFEIRMKNTHNKNRTATENTLEILAPDTVSVPPPQLDTTEEKRPPKGVKAAKRAKLVLSMEHRTVVAQETFSRSMTMKVEVLKEQIRVNQAQQRLTEEEALHRMLNDLFKVEPIGPAHAAYINKRQKRLLRRLDALLDEPSQAQAVTPQTVVQSESNENAASVSNRNDVTDSQVTILTPDMSFSPPFEPLPAAIPVVLGPITSLTLSGSQNPSITLRFPPLAQSSPKCASIPDSQKDQDFVDL